MGGTAADEHGAGTVLLLGAAAVALVLLVATAGLVGAQRARVTAQTAADLAALAAAAHLADLPGAGSPTSACGVARAVAVRNGARLTGCTTAGTGSVTVTTARGAPAVGTASARARAGPSAERGPP